MTEEKHSNKNINFHNFTWPLILIFSGALLLLNNLGIVGWEVWNVIFHFWPLLLILAGLEYILGNSFITSLLSFIITLVVLTFVFLFSISTVNSSFNKYLSNKYPFWNQLKTVVPGYPLRRQVLRCPPWQTNCYKPFNF